jgi:hypothetical protein
VTLGAAPQRFEVSRCAQVTATEGVAKGAEVESEGASARGLWGETHWRLEMAGGIGWSQSGAYAARLRTFGYRRINREAKRFSARLAYGFLPFLHAGIAFDTLDARAYIDEARHDFFWSSYALAAYAEGSWPLLRGWVVPFVRVDVGVSITHSELRRQRSELVAETALGIYLAASGGLVLRPAGMPYFGIVMAAGYSTAQGLQNLLGDSHDSGGGSLLLGVRGEL